MFVGLGDMLVFSNIVVCLDLIILFETNKNCYFRIAWRVDLKTDVLLQIFFAFKWPEHHITVVYSTTDRPIMLDNTEASN
jgi:nicotinamide riboside transporter PnuC